MCGIAGIAGARDRAFARNCACRMLAELALRGPDAEGLDSWPDATLAHRRLSIFDLSDAGRQPMLTPDGEIGIVFNGAVYKAHASGGEKTVVSALRVAGEALQHQVNQTIVREIARAGEQLAAATPRPSPA